MLTLVAMKPPSGRDRRLIDPELLNRDELAWLNAYHAQVRRKIETLLKGADHAWLRKATAPIR